MKNFVTAILIAIVFTSPIYAQKSSSSSKPSSSRPTTSTPRPTPAPTPKPSNSAPSSRPNSSPAPSTRPPASSNFSKPPSVPVSKEADKSSSTPSSRPNTNPTVSKPVVVENKPTPSSRPNANPVSKPVENKPVVESKPTPSSRPNATPTVSTKPSEKPNIKFDSTASNAKKQEESAKVYKASTTPKPSYTTQTGQVVKVNPNDASVKTVRSSLDSDKYANRTTRVEHHYHNYYGNRYDYYRSRPYIDVGGGYSTLFWYSMMDWSLERRAMWMYNNQNNINQQLYAQQLADNAQLRSEVEALRTRGTTVNPHYVDNEFKENPDLMYSEQHVDAVYNPVVHATVPVVVHNGPSSWTVFWFVFGLGIFIVVVYLVFIKEWKVE